MPKINTIKNQNLPWMHCNWLKIFGPNLTFYPKTIIPPNLGKRDPNIQSSLFNTKVSILVKNTTP